MDQIGLDNPQDPAFIREQYGAGETADALQFPIVPTNAIVSINGIPGPSITLSGGTTGLSYATGGSTLTLTGVLVAANGGTGQSSYTKGDLLAASAVTTLAKFGVGTDGQVLTADAASSAGLKWVTPGSGIGTVTSVSVVTANGFAGTVATATTTPAITLTTTITGVLKGDGTAVSAAASADIITTLGYTPTNAAIVPNTIPAAGRILVGNAGGTAYAPVAMSSDATLASTGALTLASVISAAGPIGDATHVPQITFDAKGRLTTVTSILITGTAPGGSAGGDLSGTYPNPTVAKINGVTLGTTTATSGNVLIGSGSQWATQAISGSGATITLSSAGVMTISAIANASLANSAITINGTSVSLGGTRTLTLASADFANQGTTTTVLHGNAAGNPSFGQIVNADITNSTIDLTAKVTGALPIANGGTNATSQTSNGVAYFDGTKITTGTAFKFDGTKAGIGTAPTNTFDVANTAAGTITSFTTTSGGRTQGLYIDTSVTSPYPLTFKSSGDSAGDMAFATGNTERMRLTTAGNEKLAGTATRGTTEGTNHLDIFDGTAPVGTLANGISLYSTSGELRVMDSAGNATLLSPHDKQGRWIHDEVNFKGRRLRVDMERLVLALDELLGGGFVVCEEGV